MGTVLAKMQDILSFGGWFQVEFERDRLIIQFGDMTVGMPRGKGIEDFIHKTAAHRRYAKYIKSTFDKNTNTGRFTFLANPFKRPETLIPPGEYAEKYLTRNDQSLEARLTKHWIGEGRDIQRVVKLPDGAYVLLDMWNYLAFYNTFTWPCKAYLVPRKLFDHEPPGPRLVVIGSDTLGQPDRTHFAIFTVSDIKKGDICDCPRD